MPSKGVDIYSYVTVGGCEVHCEVPGSSFTGSPTDGSVWKLGHLEVDASKIEGLFNTVGRFGWSVHRAGAIVAKGWNDINSLTGNVEGGTMTAIQSTPAIVLPDMVVTYGFYDAGPGKYNLPSSHQFYVAVTSNGSNWMGREAPLNSIAAAQPFSSFVLPAAHDAGMNSMQNVELLLNNITDGKMKILLEHVPGLAWFDNFPLSALKLLAPNIIYGLSITQKDTITAQLAIGVRYFEFRPAHMHDALAGVLPDVLYFQHACIPGLRYDAFLTEVLTFLNQHPLEVIVVNIRWDGVLDGCRRPDDAELQSVMNTVMSQTQSQIQVGNLDDMRNRKLSELRNGNKRLLWMKDVDADSNYSDQANATLDGTSIVKALDTMASPSATQKPLVVLQCQATATNIKDVVVYSVLAANAATSCLMATKAVCTSKTLAWIREKGRQRFNQPGKLAVIMNDFMDGATAETAILWNQQVIKAAQQGH